MQSANYSEDAALEPAADVHPTSTISGDVVISSGVTIGPYCVLQGPLVIHEGASIGAHCIIGGPPEHRSLGSAGILEVGAGTVIRDGCVVHHGTTARGTRIGARCYVMSRVYIGHDCQIDDLVTLSAGVSVGGHVHLQRGCNIGMNSAIHQHSTIGSYAMIGMCTPVSKDVPPFALAAGNPIRMLRVNEHAIQQLNLAADAIAYSNGRLEYADSDNVAFELLERFAEQSSRNQLCCVERVMRTPNKPR